MSWAMDPLDGEPVHIPGSHASDQTRSQRNEVGSSGAPARRATPGRHMASIGDDQVVAAWPGDHEPTVADLGEVAP